MGAQGPELLWPLCAVLTTSAGRTRRLTPGSGLDFDPDLHPAHRPFGPGFCSPPPAPGHHSLAF